MYEAAPGCVVLDESQDGVRSGFTCVVSAKTSMQAICAAGGA